MQVFIIGTPLETAEVLDARRLRKQLIEVKQILDALDGWGAWSNHPCVLQYKADVGWLRAYKVCLNAYVNGQYNDASKVSEYATRITPDWHTQRYYDNMKARLYTKNPQHYAQFAEYGKSEENWYFVDGEWRKYVNGKRIQ